MRLGIEESLLISLAVYVDKKFAQLTQYCQSCELVVNEDFIFACS
jgi:hypothetical protein